MSFKEYLIESRSAPFYHSTTIESAITILDKNFLHIADDSWQGYPQGVSFTRSYKYTKTFAKDYMSHDEFTTFGYYRIVFEADQRKLANDYKIVPFNWFDYKTRVPGDYDQFENQSEERVIGRKTPVMMFDNKKRVIRILRNFRKYLTKVIIDDYEKFLSVNHNQINKTKNISIIMDHPLLYDMKTKRFVNK
jgi:uroporphyrinogen-III decarboxylase